MLWNAHETSLFLLSIKLQLKTVIPSPTSLFFLSIEVNKTKKGAGHVTKKLDNVFCPEIFSGRKE